MTSSGYMPPVSSNSARRSSVSVQPKRCGDAGQVPDRLDRRLGDQRRAAGAAGRGRRRASRPLCDGLDHLGQDDVRLGDGDGGPDVVPRRQLGGERLGDDAPHGSMLTIRPGSLHGGYGPIDVGRRGVGEVGPVRGLSAPAATARAR